MEGVPAVVPSKTAWLDFEQPIIELEERIRTLEDTASLRGLDVSAEVERLHRRVKELGEEIFSGLDPWQRVQLARHPRRPTTLDYLDLVCGMAWLGDHRVLAIGHQKGRDTKSNIHRNFGMAHPEGYRKALRLMELAARHGRPVVTFIDTPGAYPGIGAEERGQGEAIARNLREMASLPVPVLVFITGEGGSGGALAVGVGNRVTMLENSIYSVISPEGCAAILWRDRVKAPEAARAMKITAADALELGVIDRILPEPPGGAHRDHAAAAAAIRQGLLSDLAELSGLSAHELVDHRIDKFLAMGVFDARTADGR